MPPGSSSACALPWKVSDCLRLSDAFAALVNCDGAAHTAGASHIHMLPLAGLSLGGLFRLDPAGPTTLDAIAILHITDVHADPLYDVSWYGCGHKGCTRNLTWQDAKGKPTKNLCSSSGKTERVAGQCGPWDGSHESMAKFWKEMIQPGPMCPCGVAFSNPPYSVIPPLRAALEEFAQDGFASQAAIYTGDV